MINHQSENKTITVVTGKALLKSSVPNVKGGMMAKEKTFLKGGVHPQCEKARTNSIPIQIATNPSTITLPLQQHIGVCAESLVKPQDTVIPGQLIAKQAGFISAPIHSPIAGTVTEIKKILLPNNIISPAVIIQPSEEINTWKAPEKAVDWQELTQQELIHCIADHGIIGMGGAGFPTHAKLTFPSGKNAEYFILNGAECEPYLTADHRLMLEKTEAVLQGCAILVSILNVKAWKIGIEINKLDVIHKMKTIIKKIGYNAEVVPLKVKYPQGDEKKLIQVITGRQVPSGGLPIDIGCIVSNAATVLAVQEAVVWNKPLIERVVTVSGGAVAKPANLLVKIGTPISELFQQCGGFREKPACFILGGPMMGTELLHTEIPVMKGTSGVLALTKNELLGEKTKQTYCIQCGRCAIACPVGLNPTQLYKAVDHRLIKNAVQEGVCDCRECGCCSYVCPAHLPLVQAMKLGKVLRTKLKIS